MHRIILLRYFSYFQFLAIVNTPIVVNAIRKNEKNIVCQDLDIQ